MKQLDVFRHTEAGRKMRMSLSEAQALTNQSLHAYGRDVDTWVVGYSGGKDSSATLTYIDWAMGQELIPTPQNRIVVYSDTLMELPPLEDAASQLLNKLQSAGWDVIKTVPKLETQPQQTERFFVTMLGRGYAPPSNRFRWCTQRLKTAKIDSTYKAIAEEYGDFLGIDGIRKGESAARDALILASCSTDDGECGQGWYHNSPYGGHKLSPILHWRVCHVWDWLLEADVLHGYPVAGVAETYGISILDGDEPLSARTGCLGCPLVTTGNPKKPKLDKALQTVISQPKWQHLAPFQRLSEIFWQLRWDDSLRHLKSNGTKGCLKLSARLWALEEILKMQAESAKLAAASGAQPYVLISSEEELLIRTMIANRTFPDTRKYLEGFDLEDQPESIVIARV